MFGHKLDAARRVTGGAVDHHFSRNRDRAGRPSPHPIVPDKDMAKRQGSTKSKSDSFSVP